jgi:hypothetical protein
MCADLSRRGTRRPYLREVDVDAAVVDKDVVHLEVRAAAVLLLLELDKAITERVAGLVVADDLRAAHGGSVRRPERKQGRGEVQGQTQVEKRWRTARGNEHVMETRE